MIISRFSIVTLIFFILSIFFVIFPVHIPISLRKVGRYRIPINLATAPILTIAILWAAQCLGATQIRDGIVGTDDVKPYNILILFFSLAYQAITLDVTGILKAAAFWVSNRGGSKGWKLYFYFYVMLTALSVVLGNDPVILSGTVFLVYYTSATGLQPVPWLMAEFTAANTASMVLFLGNPTNVVVCEGFLINNVAFTAYTILPFLACSVAAFLALAVQFRDHKHIPRKLRHVGHLNPRGVLQDPFGALIGSILLGSCLAVIIVVSFFHVDVWMISLPFAVAKFIFDFGWDHYRYTRNMLPHQRHPHSGTKEGQNNIAEQESPETDDDPMLTEIRRAMTIPNEESITRVPEDTNRNFTDKIIADTTRKHSQSSLDDAIRPPLFPKYREHIKKTKNALASHFPTFFTALPRLPFGLVPFAFSQFILIEALTHQGWIEVFAGWLVRASDRKIHPSIWLIGVLGVILCNLAGTNIGATILLTKVVRAAELPSNTTRATGIALAVASNIGAVSFVFSASLAGLLWTSILEQKGIKIHQYQFALWNLLPIFVMTSVGLGVVSAEMAVLYG